LGGTVSGLIKTLGDLPAAAVITEVDIELGDDLDIVTISFDEEKVAVPQQPMPCPSENGSCPRCGDCEYAIDQIGDRVCAACGKHWEATEVTRDLPIKEPTE
jgi:hypothetical protein